MKRLTRYSNKVSMGDFSITYSEILDDLPVSAVLDFYANELGDRPFFQELKKWMEKNYEEALKELIPVETSSGQAAGND